MLMLESFENSLLNQVRGEEKASPTTDNEVFKKFIKENFDFASFRCLFNHCSRCMNFLLVGKPLIRENCLSISRK